MSEVDEKNFNKERKRRQRTSPQEKYEFLMSLVGKCPEELMEAKMPSGLPYISVIHQIQVDYNSGKLKLTSEQIEELRKNGFLNFSQQEQQDMANEAGLPKKYILDIVKKYGSYQVFLEKYKKGEIDYSFKREVFCGYRGITVSENEITEEQKLAYANLFNAVVGEEDNKFLYIDIDGLKNALSSITEERQRQVIQMRFGLNGKRYSLQQTSEAFGISNVYARQIEAKALRFLRRQHILKLFLGNIDDERGKLQEYEALLEVSTSEREHIEEKIRRYDIAHANYLTQEDIFNPQGIVPAAPRARQTEQSEIKTGELKQNETQGRSREELITSIENSQEELARLRKILADKQKMPSQD